MNIIDNPPLLKKGLQYKCLSKNKQQQQQHAMQSGVGPDKSGYLGSHGQVV